ncbi:TPA: hypothetical protein PXO92_004379 [Yersinia enterocolitica]|nr:hypothetical protein [Yersinia enterocolitica]
MFKVTNPRCLIIGCGKGYREDLVVPHNHTEYTLDIDPSIQPDFVADITKEINLDHLGQFDEIYFENVILLDFQVVLNVKKLLIPGRGKLYFVGELSPHIFERIKAIYTPLNFHIRMADIRLSQRIKAKLFPQILIDCFGTDCSVIELTQAPLPSFNDAFGFLLKRN